MIEFDDGEETWERIRIESGVYVVGTEYPNIEFPFCIKGVSEKNAFLSNNGIKTQIKQALNLDPERERVVYFYYKLND